MFMCVEEKKQEKWTAIDCIARTDMYKKWKLSYWFESGRERRTASACDNKMKNIVK